MELELMTLRRHRNAFKFHKPKRGCKPAGPNHHGINLPYALQKLASIRERVKEIVVNSKR